MRFSEEEFFEMFEASFETIGCMIQDPLRKCEYLQRFFGIKVDGVWLPPADILGIFEGWKYLKSREKAC
jgi:hypothetical protein